MSTAALLWTHNEPDVLFPNLRHLLDEVDEILIRDRDSDPAVKKELERFARQNEQIILTDGGDRYDQSGVMTEMMLEAMERGHEWVCPIDPDEVWYANGKPIRDVLAQVSRDAAFVTAELYNHLPSALDPPVGTPFETIGWRQKSPLLLGKIAARCRPDLVIEVGNHSARTRGIGLSIGPVLVVRHYPWRTEDQFIERTRSAYEQLKKSKLPESSGVHVRAYGKCLEEEGEEELRKHFRHWFYSSDPRKDDTLIYDPVPI